MPQTHHFYLFLFVCWQDTNWVSFADIYKMHATFKTAQERIVSRHLLLYILMHTYTSTRAVIECLLILILILYKRHTHLRITQLLHFNFKLLILDPVKGTIPITYHDKSQNFFTLWQEENIQNYISRSINYIFQSAIAFIAAFFPE